MKKLANYTILENTLIAKDTYKMVLQGEVSWINKPGKFINISVDKHYLKRPISICDYDSTTLTIIYKVVGSGTKWLGEQKQGKQIEALINLGNGFDYLSNDALIIGGGVGVPPLYVLAKRLKEQGKHVTAILGFSSKDDAFYIDEFKAVCDELYVCTNDGTYGEKGFVTDIMQAKNLINLNYYTCGPTPMLKAVHKLSTAQGLLSLEERMGCGFGACMGCSCKTKDGYKRVCAEGPVFSSEEILWNNL